MATPPITTCAGCGAPIRLHHDAKACAGYRRRAELRADGWAPWRLDGKLLEFWPETRDGPNPRWLIGGFGVHGESVATGPWVRANGRTSARVAAAEVLHRRDRLSRATALRRALELDGSELDRVLEVEPVVVPATACGGHRLHFHGGGLHAFDHEHPRPGTRCRILLDAWTTGTGARIKVDFARGAAPFYERVTDPVPELTRLRRLLGIAIRHRLIEQHASEHPWLPDRLDLHVGGATQPVDVHWDGAVPMVTVSVPPSWLRRPTSVDLSPPVGGTATR